MVDGRSRGSQIGTLDDIYRLPHAAKRSFFIRGPRYQSATAVRTPTFAETGRIAIIVRRLSDRGKVRFDAQGHSAREDSREHQRRGLLKRVSVWGADVPDVSNGTCLFRRATPLRTSFSKVVIFSQVAPMVIAKC